MQHPLDWIERAHTHGWGVLLDTAAYPPATTEARGGILTLNVFVSAHFAPV